MRYGRPLFFPVPLEDLPLFLQRRAAATGNRYYGAVFAYDLDRPVPGRYYAAAEFQVVLDHSRAIAVHLVPDGYGARGIWDDTGTEAIGYASAVAGHAIEARTRSRAGWTDRLMLRRGVRVPVGRSGRVGVGPRPRRRAARRAALSGHLRQGRPPVSDDVVVPSARSSLAYRRQLAPGPTGPGPARSPGDRRCRTATGFRGRRERMPVPGRPRRQRRCPAPPGPAHSRRPADRSGSPRPGRRPSWPACAARWRCWWTGRRYPPGLQSSSVPAGLRSTRYRTPPTFSWMARTTPADRRPPLVDEYACCVVTSCPADKPRTNDQRPGLDLPRSGR